MSQGNPEEDTCNQDEQDRGDPESFWKIRWWQLGFAFLLDSEPDKGTHQSEQDSDRNGEVIDVRVYLMHSVSLEPTSRDHMA